MDTLKYLGKKFANLLIVLLVLSLVTFVLLYLAGNDPARSLVGAKSVSEAQLAAIRAQYHLDDPLWLQYVHWLGNVLQGNLGTSTRTQLPVTTMIGQRMGVTIALSLLALGLALVVGVPLGTVAAKHSGKWQDHSIGILAMVGLSAPSYAVGLLLLYLLAVKTGLFPIYGLGDGSVADALRHLLLPAITLAVGILASIIKITRSALLAEIGSDYALFARSRGVAPLAITTAQLQNAALPIVTATGLLVASLISGTIIVEATFSLGGIGTLLQESVTFGDIPTVQAITLILATIICVATTLVDIITTLIDPRLRAQKGVA